MITALLMFCIVVGIVCVCNVDAIAGNDDNESDDEPVDNGAEGIVEEEVDNNTEGEETAVADGKLETIGALEGNTPPDTRGNKKKRKNKKQTINNMIAKRT